MQINHIYRSKNAKPIRSAMPILVAVVVALGRKCECSGSWSIDGVADWQQGTPLQADVITLPGSIQVLRNFSDDFTYAGGNYDPLPSYWVFESSNGFFERTSNLNHLRLISSAANSDWWFSTCTAPKLYQPIDGDVVIESQITSGTTPHDYGAAQIFVMQDSLNWFGVGLTLGVGGYKWNTRVTSNGSSVEISSLAGANGAKFRIVRADGICLKRDCVEQHWCDICTLET